uniref:Histone-lysine N-methyltransferase n=1 Tax=Trichuris muris TaxID=70415 RepID=A0A5S6R2J6_TRIMR
MESVKHYYEVEEIVDQKVVNGKTYYMVKWKHWPVTYNNWEPVENLYCPRLIQLFHEKKEPRGYRAVKSLPSVVDRSAKGGLGNSNTVSVSAGRENGFDVLRARGDLTPKANYVATPSGCCLNGSPALSNTETEHRTSVAPLNGEQSVAKKSKEVPKFDDVVFKKFLNDFSPALSSGDWAFERIGNTKFTIEFKSASALLPKGLNGNSMQQLMLKEWERSMNAVCAAKGISSLTVENFVDEEGPPPSFHFIVECVYCDNMSAPVEAPFGCRCSGVCMNEEACCPLLMEVEFPYTSRGTLAICAGHPIYECSSCCSCSDDCVNRVVQKGRRVRITIFRTSDGRGWGVKTLEPIEQGAFVMEYTGEIITNVEAERRGSVYDNVETSYLFDLDFYGDPEYVIDARYFGNESHFLNHSCDPNLQVFAVWVQNYNPLCPRIAFFAKRDIGAYEELTFDYLMNPKRGDAQKNDCIIHCKCKSTNCRGNLYSKHR